MFFYVMRYTDEDIEIKGVITASRIEETWKELERYCQNAYQKI